MCRVPIDQLVHVADPSLFPIETRGFLVNLVDLQASVGGSGAKPIVRNGAVTSRSSSYGPAVTARVHLLATAITAIEFHVSQSSTAVNYLHGAHSVSVPTAKL